METLEISKDLIIELSKEIEKIDQEFKHKVNNNTDLELIEELEKIDIIKDINNNAYLISDDLLISEFSSNDKINPDFITIDCENKIVNAITYKLATFMNKDILIERIKKILNTLVDCAFEFKLYYFHFGNEAELNEVKYKEDVISSEEFADILEIKEKLIERRVNQEAKLTSHYLVRGLEE